MKTALLLPIFALIGAFTGTNGFAKSPPQPACGSVHAVGLECAKLEAEFDLHGCPDPGVHRPVVTCQPGGATLVWQGVDSVYEVALERVEGLPGTVIWVPKTGIQRSPRHKAKRVIAGHPTPVATPQPMPMPSPLASAAPLVVASPAPSAPIAFSGIFDGYYLVNFNHPANLSAPSATAPSLPANQNQYRAFDLYHDQFAVNLVELTAKAQGKEVAFKADLDFGEQADAAARNPDGASIDEVSKHFGQAIFTYSPVELPRWTFSFGKMDSHMGYETIKARDNWQYSRSFLFQLGLPLWHLGANANFTVIPGALVAGVYLYNGWNSIYDTNSAKTLGLQLTATPIEALSLTYNLVTGAEQPGDDGDRKTVHELIAAWTPAGIVNLAGDFIYGTSANDVLPSGRGNARWYAGSLAALFALGERAYVSPRIEAYRDPQGYTSGVEQTLDSLTLTGSYKLTPQAEARVEFRRDHSSAQAFHDGDGNARSDQDTLTLAVIYGF